MIKLIKNVEVYMPEYIGKRDILIAHDKISKIGDSITVTGIDVEVIDGKGKKALPGFIDSHVHITGGGGEGGYKTRTPEIVLSDIIKGGITTIIGTLGTDGVTRSLENLYAKAKALEEEGVTTYIYTGAYRVPTVTFTGSIMKDLVLIDKVIGVGEIAISDHRSSQPNLEELKRLTADARVAGILSGKAGVVNIHMGDGKDGLNKLIEIAETTEIPITQFYPTHINRNPYLFEQGIQFAKMGGFIDFTTSSDPLFYDEGEVKASIALKTCIEKGLGDNITFTSDGQGSLPNFNEKGEFIGLKVGRVTSLFNEVRDAVLDGVQLEQAVKAITSNPAKILKLKGKGKIYEGYDADIVLVDEDYYVDTVISKGHLLMKNKKVIAMGTFEMGT
ncbi:Isoaspartyl dipeptidase [Caloramator mitchellensis]|uniref:Isoaspartyl dipeptidase n=1 Tax=Caloramator mitchellensis TaxID=908809 RepID=A0A0R3JQZ5_CALMK|nr:beta-aspartyl-peptidase [Caloramator mitchellensis]KRQ85832.1 Isoaspartyl dipeptidase [Caloramator mitchellensis]